MLKNVNLEIVQIHVKLNQLQIPQRNEVDVEHSVGDHRDDIYDKITLQIRAENIQGTYYLLATLAFFYFEKVEDDVDYLNRAYDLILLHMVGKIVNLA